MQLTLGRLANVTNKPEVMTKSLFVDLAGLLTKK